MGTTVEVSAEEIAELLEERVREWLRREDRSISRDCFRQLSARIHAAVPEIMRSEDLPRATRALDRLLAEMAAEARGTILEEVTLRLATLKTGGMWPFAPGQQ